MKNLLVLTILFLNGISLINAQNFFEEFGKISPEEVKMTSCSYDTSAVAVVLFDVGKSSFINSPNGFDVVFDRITRIKILQEAGKEYAIVSIPFYEEGNNIETVEIIKACTYTITNGGIRKIKELDIKTCYEEKLTKNWRTLKFAMPDVQPGSIIEYKYKIVSPYKFNLHDWDFQWDIPTLYSEYLTHMIPFYEYTWLLQGRTTLDELKQYKVNSSIDNSSFRQDSYSSSSFYDMVYKFGLKNIPAFIDEEFIPSREDCVIKIDFQMSAYFNLDGGKILVMTTWPDLVNDYLKHTDFGKYIKKSQNASSNVLKPDSITGKTQLQKFNYIVDYAKDNFKWNGEDKQFADKSPSDLQKDKIGNSAEINLWLVGALREAGLEAYPLLLSTRKHGKIRSDYPFSSAFNTVVAYVVVDGNQILTDATDPYCPNTRISIQCMNDKGLLADKNNLNWISLQSPSISNLFTFLKIDSIGKEQHAVVIVTANNYEAVSYKNKYADNREILLTDLSKKMYQVNDSSLKFKFSQDRTKPYAFSYGLTCKSEIINNKIYIQPFLNEIFSKNPLTQKNRTYPVDMTYPVNRTYHSEIIIPEGYKAEFLPGNSSQSDELFELEYSALQTENKIVVLLTYSFKKPVYPTEDYSKVKALFDRIVKKSSEKIVLVRK